MRLNSRRSCRRRAALTATSRSPAWLPPVGVGIAAQFKSYLARMNAGTLPCVGKTWLELRAIEDAKTGALNMTWPEGCPGSSPVVRPETVGGGVAQTVERVGGTIGFAGLPEAEEKGSDILALENDGQRSFTSKAAALAASYASPTAERATPLHADLRPRLPRLPPAAGTENHACARADGAGLLSLSSRRPARPYLPARVPSTRPCRAPSTRAGTSSRRPNTRRAKSAAEGHELRLRSLGAVVRQGALAQHR